MLPPMRGVTAAVRVAPCRRRPSRCRPRAGVFLQVYLIGAYVFGADSDALDAHTDVGFTVHGLEVLLFVFALVAWLPRADTGLSLLMALLGTTQIALADARGWMGGLHRSGRSWCPHLPPRSFAATFGVAVERWPSAMERQW